MCERHRLHKDCCSWSSRDTSTILRLSVSMHKPAPSTPDAAMGKYTTNLSEYRYYFLTVRRPPYSSTTKSTNTTSSAPSVVRMRGAPGSEGV